MPVVEFGQRTHVGARESNEDAIGHWAHEDGLVFALADGLGGHAAGEVASGLALEIFADRLERSPGSWPLAKRLRRAVQEANLALHSKALAVPELRGMATTLTASAVVGGSLVTAHVGDCRLFLLRGSATTQLTKDHTWVAEQVQYGLLSAQAARTHPRRHTVTRCLGSELIVGIDILSFDLQPGDMLVQCSDGVHGVLEGDEIAAILAAHEPETACEQLIERALAAGSEDNLSAQVARVVDCPPPVPRPWWRFGR